MGFRGSGFGIQGLGFGVGFRAKTVSIKDLSHNPLKIPNPFSGKLPNGIGEDFQTGFINPKPQSLHRA